MNITKHLIVTILALSLLSCGSEPEAIKEAESKTEASDDKKQQSAAVQLPGMKALNKVKTMEQKLQDAEAERKKKMNEQEDGTSEEDEEGETDADS